MLTKYRNLKLETPLPLCSVVGICQARVGYLCAIQDVQGGGYEDHLTSDT
jgi:hypothetical protein